MDNLNTTPAPNEVTSGVPEESSTAAHLVGMTFSEIRKLTGLSGAGTKWYLRYCNDGLSHDEAMKKVLDYRRQLLAKQETTQSAPETPTRAALTAAPARTESPQLKRPAATDNTNDLASEATTAKQPKTDVPSNAPERSSLNTPSPTVDIYRLGIASKTCRLTNEQLVNIEEALVDEMVKGWTSKLKFAGIQYKVGYVLIDCIERPSADWLEAVVPKLPAFADAKLYVFSIPIVRMDLPKSTNRESKEIFQLLAAQNDHLNVSLWRDYARLSSKDDVTLDVFIDLETWRTIKAKNFILNYRFGEITVKKLSTKKTTSATSNGGGGADEESQQEANLNVVT